MVVSWVSVEAKASLILLAEDSSSWISCKCHIISQKREKIENCICLFYCISSWQKLYNAMWRNNRRVKLLFYSHLLCCKCNTDWPCTIVYKSDNVFHACLSPFPPTFHVVTVSDTRSVWSNNPWANILQFYNGHNLPVWFLLQAPLAKSLCF